uniref:Calcium/calmodulin-dependent protein kinase type IV isoform X1 n=1 Tax=Hirondellea gigas TaxID=1518452 RepID=A0A6A7G4F7_9CRUS
MGGCSSTGRTRRRFNNLFRLDERLGVGHFSTVYACTEISTGKRFAVKVMKRSLVNAVALRDEVAVLRRVGDHPNVVALHDVFDDTDGFRIVMDYCSGGDLFSRIIAEGESSEKRTSEIIFQLASALQHIHACGITHRDLKPENILLTSKDVNANIKVGDFGLSTIIQDKSGLMKTVCGTWAYCAPEVIRRVEYTLAVDIWTLGLLMFILLSGYHPFDLFGDLNEAELITKIQSCDYNFDDPIWDDVSAAAKDIISNLLQVAPEKRMSLEKLLETDWILGRGVPQAPRTKLIDRLQQFKNFRVTVLASVATAKFMKPVRAKRTQSQLDNSQIEDALSQMTSSTIPEQKDHFPVDK